MPSVLWRCWLGGRKGIRPVKKLSGEVLTWLCVCSEVQTCTWPSWCHCHSLSLASVKSRMVLPFWYRPTRVVLEKGPLNGCVCVCGLSQQSCHTSSLIIHLHLSNLVLPFSHWKQHIELYTKSHGRKNDKKHSAFCTSTAFTILHILLAC